jgi:hypothetical protein
MVIFGVTQCNNSGIVAGEKNRRPKKELIIVRGFDMQKWRKRWLNAIHSSQHCGDDDSNPN